MKLKSFSLPATLLMSVLIATPSTLLAMDAIDFNVPIKIPNMHGEVHQVKLLCTVVTLNTKAPFGEYVINAGGLGTHQVDAIKTVRVDFLKPLKNCSSHKYRCGFQLRHYQTPDSPSSFLPPLKTTNNFKKDKWRLNKKGATFIPMISGSFKTSCPTTVDREKPTIKTRSLRMEGIL